MKEFKILKVEEQNSFYNESRSNNGGGYSQPITTFELDGIKGTFDNTSCGDFGKRFSLRYNGKILYVDTVSREPFHYTTFDEVEDEEIIEIFNEELYSLIGNYIYIANL